jgi:hypothetical protein
MYRSLRSSTLYAFVLFTLFTLDLGVVLAQNNTEDPSSFVNLFIGTTNGGHVFPGELVLV